MTLRCWPVSKVSPSVAYLGFHKGGGGANIRWPLVLTQREAKPCFSFFSYGENFFLPKGSHGPMPPKYATGHLAVHQRRQDLWHVWRIWCKRHGPSSFQALSTQVSEGLSWNRFKLIHDATDRHSSHQSVLNSALGRGCTCCSIVVV